jgi:hypothetical protein
MCHQRQSKSDLQDLFYVLPTSGKSQRFAARDSAATDLAFFTNHFLN